MRIDAFDIATALGQIAAEFRIEQSPEMVRAAIVGEYIRAAIYIGAANSEGDAVPRARVMRQVLERASPLLGADGNQADLEAEIKSEIRHLVTTRDLIDTSGCLSLAPLRFIPLGTNEWLLIGGGPIQSCPIELRGLIRLCARARIVTIEPSNAILSRFPIQRQEDWLAIAIADSASWCNAFKRDAKKRLVSLAEVDNPQVWSEGRWRPLKKAQSAEELALIRFKPLESSKPSHALARTVKDANGEIRIAGHFEISYNDARRMQGIWLGPGKREEIQFRIKERLMAVDIRLPLAFPEARFLSLGTFELCSGPYQWPRKYHFLSSLRPLIHVAVTSLGFELNEVSN